MKTAILLDWNQMKDTDMMAGCCVLFLPGEKKKRSCFTVVDE